MFNFFKLKIKIYSKNWHLTFKGMPVVLVELGGCYTTGLDSRKVGGPLMGHGLMESWAEWGVKKDLPMSCSKVQFDVILRFCHCSCLSSAFSLSSFPRSIPLCWNVRFPREKWSACVKPFEVPSVKFTRYNLI